jgi:hypothetical protein
MTPFVVFLADISMVFFIIAALPCIMLYLFEVPTER